MDLDQEDASELRLGKEFTGVRCLSNAEVAIILEKTKQKYEMEDRPMTDAFEKTLAFTKRFSQTQNGKHLPTPLIHPLFPFTPFSIVVNNASAVEALRQDLQNKEITEVDEEGEIKTGESRPLWNDSMDTRFGASKRSCVTVLSCSEAGRLRDRCAVEPEPRRL